jgi:hypothetical protein
MNCDEKSIRDAVAASKTFDDSPACNCGSWHARFGLPERMQEIKDALAEADHELSNANGNLTLNALKALVAERDELRRQLAEAEPKRPIIEVITEFDDIDNWYVVILVVGETRHRFFIDYCTTQLADAEDFAETLRKALGITGDSDADN